MVDWHVHCGLYKLWTTYVTYASKKLVIWSLVNVFATTKIICLSLEINTKMATQHIQNLNFFKILSSFSRKHSCHRILENRFSANLWATLCMHSYEHFGYQGKTFGFTKLACIKCNKILLLFIKQASLVLWSTYVCMYVCMYIRVFQRHLCILVNWATYESDIFDWLSGFGDQFDTLADWNENMFLHPLVP